MPSQVISAVSICPRPHSHPAPAGRASVQQRFVVPCRRHCRRQLRIQAGQGEQELPPEKEGVTTSTGQQVPSIPVSLCCTSLLSDFARHKILSLPECVIIRAFTIMNNAACCDHWKSSASEYAECRGRGQAHAPKLSCICIHSVSGYAVLFTQKEATLSIFSSRPAC